VSAFLERLGIERPVVQAGMGGGLSRHGLAVAVSEAGGLGTIGILAPDELREEIRAAREATSKPIAVNLLLPFARRGHWEAAEGADVVTTFWGKPIRRTERTWIHQCGSIAEAEEARAVGADAVIMQGVEAGGHVRGTLPASELLARAAGRLGDTPVLSAGGVADAGDVRERLDAGAAAVVCGTRFLLTEESGAHPLYKERLVNAEGTVLTELFGAGWPAPHRVVANAATERWLAGGDHGPGWVRAVNRATAPLFSRIPIRLQGRIAESQSPRVPFLGPMAAVAGGPEGLLESGPLYAGESVARMDDIGKAGEIVRRLADG
jgi:NAD(P)H-dependent flavin oxidoreductase YrpB (nitropropane dioxygenase family)